jgi:hypothetical protein
MFTETEHLIKELIDNIGKIRQNRETNSSGVKEQKRLIENAIQELRTTINTHLSCVSTSFSICFTANNVCRSDAFFSMLTTFVWCSVSSFCFSSRESKPCELTFARKKEKQAQMSVADLLPPMSVEKYS